MAHQPFLPLSLLACACACLTTVARAAEGGPWETGAAVGVDHQSNVYRAASGLAVPAGARRADTALQLSAYGGFDEQQGRQRYTGRLDAGVQRYQHNDELNNTSYRAQLGWQGETAQRLSGDASVMAQQKLARLGASDLASLVRVLERQQQWLVNARLGSSTPYTFTAGIGQRARSYQGGTADRNDLRQSFGSVGMLWRPTDLLRLGVALRGTDGRYPRYAVAGGQTVVNDYTRWDLDFTGQWKPSGASALDWRLSPTRTRFSLAGMEDFSSLTGSVAWEWRATGKVKMTTRLTRETDQSGELLGVVNGDMQFSDRGRVSTSLAWVGEWAATAKIDVTARAQLAHRSLERVETAAVLTGSDDLRTLSLGARWRPWRTMALGCELFTEQRSAKGSLSSSYRNNGLGCEGSIMLD